MFGKQWRLYSTPGRSGNSVSEARSGPERVGRQADKLEGGGLRVGSCCVGGGEAPGGDCEGPEGTVLVSESSLQRQGASEGVPCSDSSEKWLAGKGSGGDGWGRVRQWSRQ